MSNMISNTNVYKNLELNNLEGEEWRDIPGYEGSYMVSNLGRVKSLRRMVKGHKKQGGRIQHERILKASLCGGGYLFVNLRKNNKNRVFKIHQLLMICFKGFRVDGYKLVVDHINNIRTDNRLENLQAMTARENTSKDKKGLGSSRYTGVYWKKDISKWCSEIRIDVKKRVLGYFECEEEASKRYQKALEMISEFDGCNKKFRNAIEKELLTNKI